MRKELFINTDENEVRIALLEDRMLVELHSEKTSDNFHVGDVFIGRVKKIISGLNAAFVDIGHDRDAFLHYLDLGITCLTINKYVKECLSGRVQNPSLAKVPIQEMIPKNGKIKDVLAVNQLILVQIAKEAISTKGPRLSGEIALAGRYVVLVPFADKIMVSQKITNSEERIRLRKAMSGIKPRNMGIIIRTVAKEQNVEALHADLKVLLDKWNEIVRNIRGNRFPKKVISELDKVSALLRDILNDTFDAIYVNNTYYSEIRSYLQIIAPDKVDIVKLYNGKLPLFEYYDIDKQIKSSFGKSVSIRGGIYIVIEHTEALHVIDVNSGHRVNSDKTQETNAVEVNMRAAVEIARQLRLRDMGGIIVIDFIDMHEAAHRKRLYNCLVAEMQKDKARHTILAPNKFGLVQITRQRVRPEVNIDVRELCPSCNGTGMVRPPVLIIDDIENSLQLLVKTQKEKNLTLVLHPFLYAYLTRHFYALKWMFKHRCRLRFQSKNSFQLLEYRFYSKKVGEINFWSPNNKKTTILNQD
ncbi:MAG: Rne/Rng family ribonuclease [Bacteroidales bacterium]|nr:Rne/Rng family ribonuclease [Bacteroidales bacterium]